MAIVFNYSIMKKKVCELFHNIEILKIYFFIICITELLSYMNLKKVTGQNNMKNIK